MQHKDDTAVDRFSDAMKAKMARGREKGRGGWDDPEDCSEEFLAGLLIGHLTKGNPGNYEDIACLAMMLHQRGASPEVLARVADNRGYGKRDKAIILRDIELTERLLATAAKRLNGYYGAAQEVYERNRNRLQELEEELRS